METPNELMVVFSNTVTAGFSALQGSVNGVFGLLIALVVALTGIQWALSPNREVLASGFGKVLLIGAFAWIINDWQTLSETIYAGFLELGLTAGGGSLSREEFLNPGAVLQQGWEIVKALGETPAPVENPLDVVGNMTDALILGLAMIGIMLAFAVLALQIIVSLLEFKIITLGGFVLLPFGIWNKTAFLAERPLGYVVSSGLKVLALAIVVSGARAIFDQLQPSTNPDIYEALTILVAALLLAMLAIFIPNLASALVTGGPALGAGAALTGGLAVAGAGALAAGGVVGTGAALAGRGAAASGAARSAAGASAASRTPGGGGSGGGSGPRPPSPGRPTPPSGPGPGPRPSSGPG
ncbi:MAG: P-type conjugative transfer protein TrbL, partial [Brevundimonas sp.]|nr:P-type conjugative transfer protein TrbL [Brevundimonas sp.]